MFNRNTRRGFTLIELLIAVLIIGVLAAIAVPQYQKAVLKSRFSSLMALAKALRDGNESYYLEHGQYTNDPTKLDVRANNSNAQITLGNESQHKYVLLTRDDINNNLRMYQQKSKNFPGETHCEALIDDDQANWLCRDGLKGTLIGNKRGYTVYSLSPEIVGTLDRIEYNGSGTFRDGDVCVGTVRFGCATVGYIDGGLCIAKRDATGACISTFNHAYCIGEGTNAANYHCSGNFTNHSVCYAVGPYACRGANRRYDATSCCAGEYCPTQEETCAYKGITPPPMPNYQNY